MASAQKRIRKLRNRKRRKNSGRPVRLSNAVLECIRHKLQDSRSVDAYFRRVFGLPDWRGNEQPLIEGCLEPTTGRFFLKQTDWEQTEQAAYETAMLEAARLRTRKVLKPIRMREIA